MTFEDEPELQIESFATWVLGAQIALAAAGAMPTMDNSTITDTMMAHNRVTASVEYKQSQSADPVIRAALDLMPPQDVRSMPPILVAMNRPAIASKNSEGFVISGGDAKTIYIAGYSAVYQNAKAGDHDAIKRIAGIIAHERYHIEHGPAEGPAYDAEIQMLHRVGASPSLVQGVFRAKDFVLKTAGVSTR